MALQQGTGMVSERRPDPHPTPPVRKQRGQGREISVPFPA